MLINEVSKLTKLTKKAIEYYTLQGLISPSILDNGYREYSSQDIDTLNKISVLRKLDISTEEIRCILNDSTNSALQAVSVKKELDYQRDMMKKSILQKLSEGKPYEEVSAELQAVEQGKTITDKLLDAFPGYYGRFICMHFARFLNEPIQSETQQSAYESILLFLDNVSALDIPKDLEDYLIEGTSHIGTKQISEMLKSTKKSYENPDGFLASNKEVLDQYLEFKQSDGYKNSSACKLMELMNKFKSSNGYNDTFIPAMKKLSTAYTEYYRQMEIANEKLLAQYPEIEKL
ncbi:MerR family transcriptional regulator [Sedimentibacter sp.]|uniref:MerR family transcriptional regulator n=1 Tax=Sedimentibacter sp. TaxID=1960295 RepID=UPI0028B06527|nr:MerR family transcriptional regulator [Sedimentibacter sp.]